jgi:hypothetical protein
MAVQIFISYDQEDEGLLKRLETHLVPLKRQGIINIWHDRNISAGTEWKKAISEHLNTAQIILLLISPDFMASEYLNSIEVDRAMERHERGDARVIPVLLKSSYWEIERFHKLKALPIDAKLKATPVISSRWHDEDEAFVNVVEGIHKVALELTRLCNILFYDASTGKSEFYSIDSQGYKFLLKEHQWQKIWTHIIPGNFTGGKHTDLLLYSDKTGEAKFLTVGKYGKSDEIKSYSDWRKDWTCIIPGRFTGSKYTDLLFYSSSTREGEIYTTDGHGRISSHWKYTGWQNVWTHIIPGKFTDSKYDDLLFYSSSTGQAQFYKTISMGNMDDFGSYSGWHKDWTCIVPGKFTNSKNNYTDLFIYNASTGEGEFLTTDGNGNISSLHKGSDFSKEWAYIVPGKFIDSKYTGLLFYNASTDLVRIRTTNGQGEFKGRRDHQDGPKHSTHVVYLLPE